MDERLRTIDRMKNAVGEILEAMKRLEGEIAAISKTLEEGAFLPIDLGRSTKADIERILAGEMVLMRSAGGVGIQDVFSAEIADAVAEFESAERRIVRDLRVQRIRAFHELHSEDPEVEQLLSDKKEELEEALTTDQDPEHFGEYMKFTELVREPSYIEKLNACFSLRERFDLKLLAGLLQDRIFFGDKAPENETRTPDVDLDEFDEEPDEEEIPSLAETSLASVLDVEREETVPFEDSAAEAAAGSDSTADAAVEEGSAATVESAEEGDASVETLEEEDASAAEPAEEGAAKTTEPEGEGAVIEEAVIEEAVTADEEASETDTPAGEAEGAISELNAGDKDESEADHSGSESPAEKEDNAGDESQAEETELPASDNPQGDEEADAASAASASAGTEASAATGTAAGESEADKPASDNDDELPAWLREVVSRPLESEEPAHTERRGGFFGRHGARGESSSDSDTQTSKRIWGWRK